MLLQGHARLPLSLSLLSLSQSLYFCTSVPQIQKTEKRKRKKKISLFYTVYISESAPYLFNAMWVLPRLVAVAEKTDERFKRKYIFGFLFVSLNKFLVTHIPNMDLRDIVQSYV